jgi:nitrate/nitrite transporter NarK
MTHSIEKNGLVELPQVVPGDPLIGTEQSDERRGSAPVVTASFFAMFCLVGIALWGLPFYYDFMVPQFGWTRAQVTSGNALGKLLIGPLFGFLAGWIVDRFGPRRLMIAGVLMGGIAVAGLGTITTLSGLYLFYSLNALAFVCGGPLPAQVLISRWFVRARGKAMGIAYLGIGVGGAAVPWISNILVKQFGWQIALGAWRSDRCDRPSICSKGQGSSAKRDTSNPWYVNRRATCTEDVAVCSAHSGQHVFHRRC